MTTANTAGQFAQPPHTAHPEEWFSIITTLVVTIVATFVLWKWPDYQPETSGVVWTIPVWVAFLYVLGQIGLLLVSATQVRALGVLDSIIAVAPFVTGVVALVEAGLGHLVFSEFQWITLISVLVAGLSEFLLTLWIRFVINRRTIAFESGGMS
jgi:hypothetical protein